MSERELLGLLAEAPDPYLFRSLCAHLERLGADDTAALDLAERALADWPDAMRVAPWSWCRALAGGATKKTWRLVRKLDLAAPGLGRRAASFGEIADRPELTSLTHFDLAGYEDHFDVFAKHAHRWSPRSVRLAHDWRHEAASLAALPLWGGLEELHVGSLHDDTLHRAPLSFRPELAAASRLSALTMRADDLVALWDRASLPALVELNVWVLDEAQARALASRRELASIRTLRVAFRCAHDGRSSFEPTLGNVIPESDAAARTFFERARLDALRDLTLVGRSCGYWTREGPGPDTMSALIASGALAALRRLRLERLPLGDEGLAALLRALPTSLRDLELVDVYAKNATAEALVAQPVTAKLEQLNLSANRIRSGGFAALAGVPFVALREIDLSGAACQPYYFSTGTQPLRDDGFAAWTRSSAMSTLRVLGVSGARLTDESLLALAACDAPVLEELRFAHNQATSRGTSALARALHAWRSLRTVSLRDCRLDDDAVAALTELRSAPRLRSLDVSYNAIGAAGARHLASWPMLQHVRALDLHDEVLDELSSTKRALRPLGRRATALEEADRVRVLEREDPERMDEQQQSDAEELADAEFTPAEDQARRVGEQSEHGADERERARPGTARHERNQKRERGDERAPLSGRAGLDQRAHDVDAACDEQDPRRIGGGRDRRPDIGRRRRRERRGRPDRARGRCDLDGVPVRIDVAARRTTEAPIDTSDASTVRHRGQSGIPRCLRHRESAR